MICVMQTSSVFTSYQSTHQVTTGSLIKACCATGINGFGNINASVAFVGLMPTKEEHERCKPFVGQNGKLLDAMCNSCNYPRPLAYVTNILCKEVYDTQVSSQVPICLPRFDAEMYELRPKLIITFGGEACKILTNNKIGKYRGVPIWSSKYGCYIMATNHPVSLFHTSGASVSDIVRDLLKIPLILSWSHKYHNPDYVAYTVIDSKTEAQAYLNNLPKAPHLCTIDIETNPRTPESGDIWNDELFCLSIATSGNSAAVLPRAMLDGLNWPTDIRWGLQNGPFDKFGLKQYLGVDLAIADDSMLLSYACDERTPRAAGSTATGGGRSAMQMHRGIHGLEQMSMEYCASGEYKQKVKKDWQAGIVNADETYAMNAKDSAYTYRHIKRLSSYADADGVTSLYRNILLPVHEVLSEGQYYGIKTDVVALGALLTDWEARSEAEHTRLQNMALVLGFPKRINLNSPQQMSDLVYHYLTSDYTGEPIDHINRPSVDAEVLEDIDHPFTNDVLNLRHLDKALQYLFSMVNNLKPDLRLHPEVLIHGTVSGRVSYVNPSINTIPKPYSIGAELAGMRRVFCATNSDYCLLILCIRGRALPCAIISNSTNRQI